MNTNDTIAAIATGGSISAIGIVRVSGEGAIKASDKIFRAFSKTKLADAQDRRMYYGRVHDANGELIDLCLCAVSHAPNTYTGEDTVEFHCHGSPVVLSEVLKSLFAQGVRQAQAGEFTKRAFLNGRMDLTQAEAVIDLIEAETPLGAKNAAGQLSGAVCGKINDVYDKLVDVMAHFHAVVDYPDEDIDDFEAGKYINVLHESAQLLQRLLDTHERGKLLRTGIPVAITGRTNTGKSTLFNALLGFERAIVTDVAGTTRDTIEEKILAGNVLLRLTDTAGIRETEDTVEKLGVKRTLAALEGAGLVLAVFDGSQPLQEDDNMVLKALENLPPGTPMIIVMNKMDAILGTVPKIAVPKIAPKIAASLPAPPPVVRISALTGEGLDELSRQIQKLFPDYDNAPKGELITSIRQADAIGRAIAGIKHAEEALTAKVSPDAVLTDIEEALSAVGEVTGKTMREDIISRVFERFCVGK